MERVASTAIKTAEEHVALLRFTRERQYDSVAALQEAFSLFMRLYRQMTLIGVNMKDKETNRAFQEQCILAETAVDGVILRITSEFGAVIDDEVRRQLATLRQSAQIWHETVKREEPIDFKYSDDPDYFLFKRSFSNVTTFLLEQTSKVLAPPEFSGERSQEHLRYIFHNDRESDYRQDRAAIMNKDEPTREKPG